MERPPATPEGQGGTAPPESEHKVGAANQTNHDVEHAEKAPAVADSSDDEVNGENSLEMHGVPLYMFSVGMMTVVFLLNIDHYILGR
jgi:hypothetical protein